MTTARHPSLHHHLTSPDGRKWTSPLALWAALGALAVVLQLCVWIPWIADGHLRLNGPGAATHISPIREAVLRTAEAGVGILTIGMGIILWRRTRRAKTVTFDAAMYVGWILAIWVGAFYNYRYENGLFNTHALGFPSWGPYIPGWDPPHPEAAREALFAGAVCAYPPMLLWYWAQRWALGPLLRHKRDLRVWQILPILVVSGICVDIVIEWVASYVAGFYYFPSAAGGGALFAGHWYQLPFPLVVTDGLLLSTPMTYMVYRAAQHQREIHLFRGSDHFTPRLRTCLRILAGTGFINLVWVACAVGVNLSGLAFGVSPVPADTPGFFPVR